MTNTDLPDRMRQRADADRLPADHDLRTRADALDRGGNGRFTNREADMETITITITKPQLEAAMLQWEQDARDGKCLTHAEADAMPPDVRAKVSADRLWVDLAGAPAPGQ